MSQQCFFNHLPLLAAGFFFVTFLPASAQTVNVLPKPVVWFRGDSLKALAANAPVSQWPNSSGVGPGAVQTTAGQQPIYLPNEVGGKPAVFFTAEKKTYLSFPRPVQDDFTILCVFQSKQGVGQDTSWRTGAGLVADKADAWDTNGWDDFGLSLNAVGQVLGGTGNPDSDLSTEPGFNDGKPHLIEIKRVQNLGEVTLYLDGVQVDASASATKRSLSEAGALTLGMMGHNSQYSQYLTGDIAEVQVYDTALTDTARQAVENALKTEYGIVAKVTVEKVAAVPASARLQPVILPIDPKPAIHGPQIVGASPGHPFLFRVPATGDAPLTYACADLPTGLTLEAKTGIVSGAVTKAGEYVLHLSASNGLGKAARTVTVMCGDHPLALTPPMGWDAVNIYANTVDDAKMRAAADGLITSGLAAHGWAYLHINDTWQGIRDKTTKEILPNRRRFPDMKTLADYMHGKGLKFGLTSAATEHTCAGYPGSLGNVAQDAATYAAWGVDYLEYDWCPVASLDETPPPGDQVGAFKEMHEALNKTKRDIVFGVNTFGRDNVWDWAADHGANTWVTSRQMLDDWKIVTRDLFESPWIEGGASPGHWTSPGLLQIGKFGVGDVRATRLSPCEQMSQLSQYALLSAPLWLSCDLTLLDPNKFHPSTTAMLTNDEVLDIDQDPAGHAAVSLTNTRTVHIWYKILADGTVAVGLFNTSESEKRLRVTLSDLSLNGPQPVRDVWLHQDLGDFTGTFITEIPAHGVALVKIGKAAAEKGL